MDKKLIRKHQRTTSEPNFKLNLTKKKEFEDEDAINYIKSIQRHSRVLRMNTNIWLSRPKTGLQVQKIREKNLIMEFSRSNSISNRSSVQTGLFSYKMMMQLSRDGTLKVNIPDTLVYGYGFKNPTFLYTNEDGLVKFRSSITLSHVNIVTDILESYRTSNSPLAIMKTPNRNFNRVFLHATEIKYEVNNSYKNEAVIQRYILPKGIKAFKIRIS